MKRVAGSHDTVSTGATSNETAAVGCGCGECSFSFRVPDAGMRSVVGRHAGGCGGVG